MDTALTTDELYALNDLITGYALDHHLSVSDEALDEATHAAASTIVRSLLRARRTTHDNKED